MEKMWQFAFSYVLDNLKRILVKQNERFEAVTLDSALNN